jgi:hypothetical protein
MEHLFSLGEGSGHDVVPLTQPVRVEGAKVQGVAIALMYTGNAMNYLIAADNMQSPPVWVRERDISIAWVGGPDDRPS